MGIMEESAYIKESEKDSEKGIKIEYFTIDASNPYGPTPGHTLSNIKEFCEKHTVVGIQCIKGEEGITYAVIMYKE